MKRLLCFPLLILAFFSLRAGELTFDGKTNRDPLSYQPGETITFYLTVFEDGQPVSGKRIKWIRTGDDGQTLEGDAVSDIETPITVETSIDRPGLVYLKASIYGDDGKVIDGEQHQFSGAAGVQVDQLRGSNEPEDFDAFWARQKARLAEVPMLAHLTEVPSGDDEVICYDVKVDCLGMPVSGYLSFPRNAPEKSLDAELSVQGYGVRPAFKTPELGKSEIVFQINAHGIVNDREDAYYKELSETTLNMYGFSKESNLDPEKCYWNGMALRVMRALEFIKTVPQWNGEKLIVSGGSQGGFQTILAAGLDSDVTDARASVTWLCDISGGELSHRAHGVFFPEWVPALDYYDSVNHAKRIKGRVELYAGTGDPCCRLSGELILYNNISSPVRMTLRQGGTHGFHPESAQVYEYEKNMEKSSREISP